MRRWAPTLLLSVAACATPATPSPTTSASPASVPPAPRATAALPAETHLANLRQLTFGGENAEAYWSWAGDALILQARRPEAACDRIFRLPLAADGRAASAMLPGVERARRDDLLVLPARRSRGDLRVDRGGRRRLPAAARSQPGLRLGALPRLRHLSRERRRLGRAAAHDHAGLRRRGDGLRQGRLDRLHVGARRRHRPLPDGRRRQERQAADARRRLRRRRGLRRRLHADRLARVAAQAGQGARRLQAPARAEPGAAEQARALRRRRRRQRTRTR